MKQRKDLIGGEYDGNRVGVPYTGWKCAVCFNHAHVRMIDVTLCVEHAKRYDFGYGDDLKSMREELNNASTSNS